MQARSAQDGGEAQAALPAGAGLCAFLDATAERHPARVLFIDQHDRLAWSGRPPITWTYGVAREIVGRLAGGLDALALAPGTPIGLCMAGGAEHALALLAIEEAGLLPCLLPVTWDADRLETAIEATRAVMVLTQGRVGEARPAETLCGVAARVFGLRFLAAFGPGVPDGVIPLDAVVVEARGSGRLGFSAPAGLVTFAGAPDRPVHRTAEGLVAATAAHLVSAPIEAGDRIVTVLPPDDLRGVVTGLGAALLAGAALEAHGVFSGEALAGALAAGPAHLVAPGWMEPALAAADLPALRSIALAHRAPAGLASGGTLPGTVLDVLALDEDALVTRTRGVGDLAAALLGDPVGAASTGLLRLRREADDRIALSGAACAAVPFRRNAAMPVADGWRASRFRVETFAGVAVAVVES